MSKYSLSVAEDGVRLRLAEQKQGMLGIFRRRQQINLDVLRSTDRALAIALARIRGLDRDGVHHRIEPDGLFLDHRLLTKVDDFSARILELPGRLTGYEFHAETSGTVGNQRFSLDWWWERDGRQIRLERTGAVVDIGGKLLRLPEPIYEAIELSRTFDSSTPLPAHWEALARFRESIGMMDVDSVVPEGVLKRIEIITCDRVGLSFDASNPLNFAPIPFRSERLADDSNASSETAAIEGKELENFKRDAVLKGAQPAYNIGDNRYLILDRSAIPVVEVIALHAAGTDEDKLNFIENAERIISEAIEEALKRDGKLNELMAPEDQAEAVENAFRSTWAETREWAERVIEIRKWTKPEIEAPEGSGTSWLPEDVDGALGELLGTIPDEDIAGLVVRIEHAMASDQISVSTPYGDVPVVTIVLEALRRRLEFYLARTEQTATDSEVTAYLPVTHDNFWELEFKASMRSRPRHLPKSLPSAVHRELRPYQAQAFRWQVDAWEAGLPGILNADEQGLGKTLQTLSFLAWVSETAMAGEAVPFSPFLIVAPTSLLRNWEAEIEAHLEPGIWGDPVRLYGTHIRNWRIDGKSGRDTQDGRARLDLSSLNTSGRPHIAITTYQTLANYAVSFTETPFSVVVFDEIQNIKNPATLRANAAKAVNGEFRIGLTGTPVENATRDIWAVMDQLFPGALGSLGDFRVAFDVPKAGNMRALHAAIFQSQSCQPSLGQRRTKEMVATDLPTKTRVLHPRIMPQIQTLRYDEARKQGQSLFGLLHHIRKTSLHPGLIGGEDPESFIESSARITAALDILKYVHSKNERALVFVENLDVQQWFVELIKIEFGLHRIDIINGSTPPSRRHEIAQRFQRHLINDEGFDLLIMGPRAAGTGLTLTAANHVVHLTRWWNPAVEEQCNDRTHRIGQSRPVTVHIPLAIHPRLQRGSFDCLLQNLMRRKRTLADSVLWPPEGNNDDFVALYDAILMASDVEPQDIDEKLILDGYPDLVAEELSQDTLRVSPRKGGASVIISTSPANLGQNNLTANDVAALFLANGQYDLSGANIPVSVLGGTNLWPDFVLPE